MEAKERLLRVVGGHFAIKNFIQRNQKWLDAQKEEATPRRNVLASPYVLVKTSKCKENAVSRE